MIASITGLAIYEGLATSLDTLTSQAYGAGKKHLVGLHVQRMIALTLLVTIPIGAIWIRSRRKLPSALRMRTRLARHRMNGLVVSKIEVVRVFRRRRLL